MILLLAIGCSSVRILEQTDTTAVIQGIGDTQFEARRNARSKATELFGEYEETREPECSQEYTSDIQDSRFMGTTGSGRTYWSCVIYVKKR